MSQEDSRELAGISRRKTITALGAAVVPVSVEAAAVGERDGEDPLAQYRKVLTKQYSSDVAERAVEITRPIWRYKRADEITQKQYHERVTTALLNDPVADVVAKGARRLNKEVLQEYSKAESFSRKDERKAESNTLNVNSSIIFKNYDTYRNQTGAGFNSVNIVLGDKNLFVNEANISATTLSYGSSKVRFRLFGSYTPSSTGNYNIKNKYYRKGSVNEGASNFYLYRESPSGSINKKMVESVNTVVDGSKTVDKDFYLESGKEYNLGFEATISMSTGITGRGFVDYYDDKRVIEPETGMGIEYLG